MKQTYSFTTTLDPTGRQLIEALLQKVDGLSKEINRIKEQKEPGWTTLREYTKNLKQQGKKLPVSLVNFRKLRDEGKTPQMYGYAYNIEELDKFVKNYPNYIAPDFQEIPNK